MSKIFSGALSLVCCCQAGAAWYTSEVEFTSAIDPVLYLEDFDDFQYGVQLNGTQTAWTAPGANGYGWDASSPLGLWSLDGALSTSEEQETISLTFTGAPVTAFGGIFYATDLSGFVIPNSLVTVRLSDGQSYQLNTSGSEFLGWTGSTAISSVDFSVEAIANTWVAIDHVYVGSGVPEPAGLAVLGGALSVAWFAKRRRV